MLNYQKVDTYSPKKSVTRDTTYMSVDLPARCNSAMLIDTVVQKVRTQELVACAVTCCHMEKLSLGNSLFTSIHFVAQRIKVLKHQKRITWWFSNLDDSSLR